MTSDPHNNNRQYGRRDAHVCLFLRGTTWHASFQFDGKRKRASLHTPSKEEAHRRAVLMEAALQEGRYPEQLGAPALHTVSDAYLAHLVTASRAPRNVARQRFVMNRVHQFAQQRKAESIFDVNLRFVDAYRRDRAAAGAPAKTLLNALVIIRQTVDFALSRDLIWRDPLKGLRIENSSRMTQPCWQRHEVALILATCQNHDFGPALKMLAVTGMRVAELKYLTWDEVDLEQRVIRIRPKDDWRPKFRDQRPIRLSPIAQRLLQDQPQFCRWVFPAPLSRHSSRDGRPISEHLLRQYLNQVLQSLGLEGTLHTFRTSFIAHARVRRTGS